MEWGEERFVSAISSARSWNYGTRGKNFLEGGQIRSEWNFTFRGLGLGIRPG